MSKNLADFANQGAAASKRRREERIAAGLNPTMNPVEKLQEHPTRGNAINAMCWDCQGRDNDPHVRWRIANCEVGIACPLYQFRPYRHLLGTDMPESLKQDA